MKRFFLFAAIFGTLTVAAQNFRLFNSAASKVFSTVPEITNCYSLSFDSVLFMNGDSVYYNFFKLSSEPNFFSNNCPFWGGPECFKQNIPVWFGQKVETDNLFTYRFFTLHGDTLSFDFTPAHDMPTVFYRDSLQYFTAKFDKLDTMTVLGFLDTVRFFILNHYDIDGNPVNSSLNDYQLLIGKKMGLITFFQVDLFPDTIKPLQLIGSTAPHAGFTTLTNEDLYDFHEGDEVQYLFTKRVSPGPLFNNYDLYVKHSYLSRRETADSLIFTVRETRFYKDSTVQNEQIRTFGYVRHDTLARIPFERFDGAYKKMKKIERFGKKRWVYQVVPENILVYCEVDNVWGMKDTFGPHDEEYIDYAEGLGNIKKEHTSYNGNLFSYTYQSKSIIYLKQDQYVWGEEVVLDINETGNNHTVVSLFPNPASESVTVVAEKNIKELTLSELSGKTLRKLFPNNKQAVLTIRELPTGIYFIMLLTADGRRTVKKLEVNKM